MTRSSSAGKLCDEKGWEVIEPAYVDNDISAADPKKRRPAYDRLLDDIKGGKVGAVVVVAEDRLHRRPYELESFVQACDAAELTTVATVYGDTDLGDPDGLMMLRIKGVLAAREVDIGRRRMLRRKASKAEKGEWSGGHRPFGYEPDGITIRESEAIEIRKAVQRSSTARASTAFWRTGRPRGVQTTRGAPGTEQPSAASSSVHGSPVSVNTKVRLSVRLCGPASSTRRPTMPSARFSTDPSRKVIPRVNRTYPLRGLLVCWTCGMKMMGLARRRAMGKRIATTAARRTAADAGPCT